MIPRRASEAVYREPSPEDQWRSRSYSDVTGIAKASHYHRAITAAASGFHDPSRPNYPPPPTGYSPHLPQPARMRSSSNLAQQYTYPPDTYAPEYAYPQGGPSNRRSSASDVNPAARFICEYCGKGFSRPSSLKIHTNTHTGEKRESLCFLSTRYVVC
jgi:uncharacterized Zn-finger protein